EPLAEGPEVVLELGQAERLRERAVGLALQDVVAQRLAEEARDLRRVGAAGRDEEAGWVLDRSAVPANLAESGASIGRGRRRRIARDQPEQRAQEGRLAGP